MKGLVKSVLIMLYFYPFIIIPLKINFNLDPSLFVKLRLTPPSDLPVSPKTSFSQLTCKKVTPLGKKALDNPIYLRK